MNGMGRGEAKAAGFSSFLTVLRTMVPADRLEPFFTTLPADTLALIKHPPLPITWIPLDTSAVLYEAVHERLFGGDVERIFEAGRAQMKADMRGLYRVFIRIASPAYVAARTTQIWETYVRDAGKMRLVVEEPHLLEIEVTGHTRPSRAFWHFLRGNIHGVIELTGVKSPKVTILSGGGSGPDTRYRVTWQ
jgi:hypothetical protein